MLFEAHQMMLDDLDFVESIEAVSYTHLIGNWKKFRGQFGY